VRAHTARRLFIRQSSAEGERGCFSPRRGSDHGQSELASLDRPEEQRSLETSKPPGRARDQHLRAMTCGHVCVAVFATREAPEPLTVILLVRKSDSRRSRRAAQPSSWWNRARPAHVLGGRERKVSYLHCGDAPCATPPNDQAIESQDLADDSARQLSALGSCGAYRCQGIGAEGRLRSMFFLCLPPSHASYVYVKNAVACPTTWSHVLDGG